jgi:hypothetical protein
VRSVNDDRSSSQGKEARNLNRPHFKPGDWVIFRKTKQTPHPGKRAENVVPARGGDSYTYTVDKFWIVQEVRDDGTLVLRTRRGKLHIVAPTDLSLRGANWWDRIRYRNRFQAIEQEGPSSGEENVPPKESPRRSD